MVESKLPYWQLYRFMKFALPGEHQFRKVIAIERLAARTTEQGNREFFIFSIEDACNIAKRDAQYLQKMTPRGMQLDENKMDSLVAIMLVALRYNDGLGGEPWDGLSEVKGLSDKQMDQLKASAVEALYSKRRPAAGPPIRIQPDVAA